MGAMGVTRELPEIRCGGCNRLLARARVERAEIKCPRCGQFNHVNHQPSGDSTAPAERPRASQPQEGDESWDTHRATGSRTAE